MEQGVKDECPDFQSTVLCYVGSNIRYTIKILPGYHLLNSYFTIDPHAASHVGNTAQYRPVKCMINVVLSK